MHFPNFFQVLDGLKIGNEALKKANEMFSIEEIEQIMEDSAESIEKQKEIDALISGQLSAEDETEVLNELDLLISSEENLTLPEVPLSGDFDLSWVEKRVLKCLLLLPILDPSPSSAVKEKKRQKIALEAA